MSTANLTINSIRSSYPSSGTWNNNFAGMVVAGNINVLIGEEYVKKNCRTKLKFTVGSDLSIGSCTSLLFKVTTRSTSYPYPMKACLATTDVSDISSVLNDTGSEVTSSVGPLAYSLSYSDAAGTTRCSTNWTADSSTLYFKFDLSNVTLTAGTSYYIYVYRTVTSTDSAACIYGGGTYGASESSNISNYALTLTYSVPRYTLTVNNGTGGGTYDKGTVVTITANSKTGYYFTGWSGGSTSTSSSTTVTVNSTLTCTANYSPYKLTVNYYGNGATYGTLNGTTISSPGTSCVLSVDYYYGSSYEYGLNDIQNTSSLYLSRTGYSSTGKWGTTSSGGTLVDQSTSYTGQDLATALGKSINSSNQSVNVYVQWVANTYRLTFNANGGTNTSGGNFALNTPATSYGATESWVTVTYDSSNFSAMSGNNPTRTGYKFLGWYTADSGGTQIYDASGDSTDNGTYWSTSGTWISTSNQTVYAQWEALATMFVKVDGTYKAGIPYVKVDGDWKRATAVYVKVDGEWKLSTR